MNHAVTVTELVKRYHPQAPPAVDGLTFTVGQGEVFGLLGPNGAGKSTTVGVLTTRILPTSGRCLVHGADVVARPAEAKRLLAVVPQRQNLDRSLDVRQNLLFHGRYHGLGRVERVRRADELLALMGLTDLAGRRVERLSGGQAQRVVIARALVHRPEVLFLDEPFTGLDPQSRLFLHERIRELSGQGVTVVLTTHDMDEAETLSDRVGIVDHGRLLALDTPHALTGALPGGTTITAQVRLAPDPAGHDGRAAEVVAALSAALAELPGVDGIEHDTVPPAEPGAERRGRCGFRVRTGKDPSVLLPEVLRAVAERGAGAELTDLSVARPSLQDVFISLTGRELR
ncbi:ABC transporter ATP-binding protein [Kitasatospora sp. NPDC048540]|uniref:ABC transporter ATP-binding protein n=1 Tax=unclassified Kitasatospora TaxID=2633591 RepID=UPI00053B46BB|nr:ABC transporter ATP-binding protein [Kitasatospora sp. MBT63]